MSGSEEWEALARSMPERWEALELALEVASAWHWPRRFNVPEILDGTLRSLKIR